ncbi:MAG TPA: hypothetical protein VHZ50_09545 [Puia sp.]|jgi:hypothetical protein|nr:hypothetical protein [Puia sp.]
MKKNQSEAKKASKKEIRLSVYNKLAHALNEYKKDIKPKKFETNLKKASKLFATDIAKAPHKQNGTVKKPKTKVEQKQDAEVAS